MILPRDNKTAQAEVLGGGQRTLVIAALLLTMIAPVQVAADDIRSESSPYHLRYRQPAGPRPVVGWPVILDNAIRHTPSVADIDGDGRDEIAVGARDCRFYLLDSRGRPLPGWPRETAAEISRKPTLADFDGDGGYEVAAAAVDGFIHMWREDGTDVEGWPVDIGDVPASFPVPVRISEKEVCILVSCAGGSVHLLSPDGTSRKGWPKELPYKSFHVLPDRHPTGSADLDGDGTPEIVHLTSIEPVLYAWDLGGAACPGFPIAMGTGIGLGLAVDDPLDPRHIACTTVDRLLLFDPEGRTEAVLVPPDEGDRFYFAPYFISSSALPGSRPDLVLTSTEGGLIYLWDLKGKLVEGWPVRLSGFIYGLPEEEERHEVAGPPLTRDLDGDGANEIILGSYDHHLYCFDLRGRLVPGWPVVVEDYIVEALAFADLDGEGGSELLVGQYGEALYAFHVDGEVHQDAGDEMGAQRPFTPSEWLRAYYAVAAVILLMIFLLSRLIRRDLAGGSGRSRRLAKTLIAVLVLALAVRLLLSVDELYTYRKALDELAGAEAAVARVLVSEREGVRETADILAASLDTCRTCDLTDPLAALRQLERVADHHMLEYRFKGLLLADGAGNVIQGVGLARGWTDLDQFGLSGAGDEGPLLLAGVPVFVVESRRTVETGEDTLRFFLISSILSRTPNIVADSTGFSTRIRVGGRTLAWGGAAGLYTGVSPWLGDVQPFREIPVGNGPEGKGIKVLLTKEDFDSPLSQWFDLAVVLILPCVYLLAVGRGRTPAPRGLRWRWIIAFGCLYIAGTILLYNGRLGQEPVTFSGRLLEVLLHMTGITGIVVALRRIIVSRRSRQLNFALLGSYLLVSLIPLSVILLVGVGLFQMIQRNLIEDTMAGLESRAENMVLAHMGNMRFLKSLNANSARLLGRSTETSWFNFIADSQYLFNYDMPTAYMTLWATDRNDPDRYFTGYSYRAPRTGKLFYRRPAWTGDESVKGLFLDNGTAVVRAMKRFSTLDLDAQIVSHIPVDDKILRDMEERLSILPFLPRVHLEPAWLESASHAGRRHGLYLPYSSVLSLKARDWETGLPRWIIYRAGFYLPGGGDLWRVLVPLMLLILIPLGLSLWGAYTTFHRTARPLTRLLDGIRRVGGGDLEYRLQETGESDIGLAARSLDGMAESLEETIKKLAEKQKVEEISALKSRFISMVSHDLKTPLSSIRGATENILEELAGPVTERQRTYLEMIMASSSDLQRMITDILDLSRIESGRMVLNIEPIDIRRELEDLQRSIRPLLDRENLESRISVGAVRTSVMADRTRLWQILNNLFSNAIMHSPSGGKIDISIDDIPVDETEGRPMLRISVSDHGPGIEEEERSRIFEPFYSRPSKAGGMRGAGLGLAIVKQLVELHGGYVSLEHSPGGGATFVFTLPSA